MLVSTYNNNAFNDVLSIMTQESGARNQEVKRSGNVAQITNTESNEVVGFNIFEASTIVAGLKDGPVDLSADDVSKLNEAISGEGFDFTLVEDISAKFVVGYVKEIKDHEDSDHLSVTQVEVDGEDVLQIVCGASNVDQGQKVVVAKPGAVMPNGLVIWPGELRGVKSNGMICSAKELGLESNGKRGILVLEESYKVGEEFT